MTSYTEEAEEQSQRALVLKPHRAGDNSQLELAVNDIVYVLEKDASGWWGGHKEGEETTGWFPGSCVREILEKDVGASNRGSSAKPGTGTVELDTSNQVTAIAEPNVNDVETGSAAGTVTSKGDRQRRQSPVWKRESRPSSPGFSHTVDIEFSRKNDDRYKSIALVRPGSPTGSIASESMKSLPSGLDHPREIKRLRELVAELRNSKRQSDTEIRQQRNTVAKLEAEAATKRAENAQLEQRLRVAAEEKDELKGEVEAVRQELQRERQSFKKQFEQFERELADKNADLLRLTRIVEEIYPNFAKEAGQKSISVDTKTLNASAEALRRRLFANSASNSVKGDDNDSLCSIPHSTATAPVQGRRHESVEARREAIEARRGSLQSASAESNSEAGRSPPLMEKNSPPLPDKIPVGASSPALKQSDPRPGSSTASDIDSAINNSLPSSGSTVGAVGLAGRPPKHMEGSLTIPVAGGRGPSVDGSKFPGGSIKLPNKNFQQGDRSMSPGLGAVPKRMPSGSPRTVYDPGQTAAQVVEGKQQQPHRLAGSLGGVPGGVQQGTNPAAYWQAAAGQTVYTPAAVNPAVNARAPEPSGIQSPGMQSRSSMSAIRSWQMQMPDGRKQFQPGTGHGSPGSAVAFDAVFKARA